MIKLAPKKEVDISSKLDELTSDSASEPVLQLSDTSKRHSIKTKLGEWTDEIFSEEFGFRYCAKGRWWHSEWQDHKRFLIHLKSGGFNCFLHWGCSHDFIPRIPHNTDKLTFDRTSYAFRIDVDDNYTKHTGEEWKGANDLYEPPSIATIIDRKARERHHEVIRRNLPFIKEFFARMKTERDEIEWLDSELNDDALDLFGIRFTKAFLYAKLGGIEQAEYEMKRYYGANPPRESVMEQLRKTAKL